MKIIQSTAALSKSFLRERDMKILYIKDRFIESSCLDSSNNFLTKVESYPVQSLIIEQESSNLSFWMN